MNDRMENSCMLKSMLKLIRATWAELLRKSVLLIWYHGRRHNRRTGEIVAWDPGEVVPGHGLFAGGDLNPVAGINRIVPTAPKGWYIPVRIYVYPREYPGQAYGIQGIIGKTSPDHVDRV